jgi:hypothetical protein
MKRLWTVLPLAVASLLAVSVAVAAADSRNFSAHLQGENELPIPRDTTATGQAQFQLNAAGTALSYRLMVANINNAFAAHIHCGTSTQSGPIGVTLYSGATGGGRTQGVLAQGTITAPDANNACGWSNLGQVVTAMRAGTAYVNVHTNDGVAPPNTGPGDFPGGEIRGQVREGGPS